jgi:hypothetical protein
VTFTPGLKPGATKKEAPRCGGRGDNGKIVMPYHFRKTGSLFQLCWNGECPRGYQERSAALRREKEVRRILSDSISALKSEVNENPSLRETVGEIRQKCHTEGSGKPHKLAVWVKNGEGVGITTRSFMLFFGQYSDKLRLRQIGRNTTRKVRSGNLG